MTIASLNDLIGAAKQNVQFVKTPGRTTVANTWFSCFDLAGAWGAGTLAGTSTAAGVVPDDTVAGYPTLNAFGGAATGYLSKIEFANTVACRIALFDRLFVAGAYAFNATTTLASQPSYAARVPGTPDYTGLELWVETVTLFTGNMTIAGTYTNHAGTTAKSTGTVTLAAAPTVGRCMQLPFAAGDSGIQKLESITSTVASAGTFNMMILRPLWSGRVIAANWSDVHDALRTGMPQIFATSALYALIAPDSTALGVPECSFQIANK